MTGSAIEQLESRAAQISERREKQRREDMASYARVILAELSLSGGEALPVTKIEILLERLGITPQQLSADIETVRRRESLKKQEAAARQKVADHMASVPAWREELRGLEERVATVKELLRAGEWLPGNAVGVKREFNELRSKNTPLFEAIEGVEAAQLSKGGES